MRSRRWRILSEKGLAVILATSAGFFAPATKAESWSLHAFRQGTQLAQIRALEKGIQDLIESKRKTTDPARLAIIANDLVARHKELTEAIRSYDKEALHVRFKHPDRSDAGDRKYVRVRIRSLEEMENEFGLDGRLNRVKARVQRIFPVHIRTPAAASPAQTLRIHPAFRSPASEPTAGLDPEAPDRVRLVK